MKKLLLVFITFAYAGIAQAELVNFSGVWTGEGTSTAKDGNVYFCEEFTVNIKQTATETTFGRFTYSCGGLAFLFTPDSLRMDNEKVFWDQRHQFVGSINESEAHLLYVLNDWNGRGRYTVKKLSDTQIDYTDEQIDVNKETGNDDITTYHGILTLRK